MMQVATSGGTPRGNRNDDGYGALLGRIRRRFLDLIDGGKTPLFTTDAEGLWAAYLDGFPPELRQYHNCSACRHFIERYGALVTIGEDGLATPAVWHADDADEFHGTALLGMLKLVRRAKVTGVFLSGESVWGDPVTGEWMHFHLTPPSSMWFARATQTAGQAMAEKREDFKNVSVALGEFTKPILDQALTLLRNESLYRSEKVLGPAEWLHSLHVARDAARDKRNVVWRAIATAPAGFCHPRSSMVGTLLEDIAAGVSFDDASRRFAAKMHPLQYQRPQAAPSAGAIAQAEKIVEQLGAAGSLARRVCRLDEVQALWRPAAAKAPATNGNGVFAHLTPKGAAPMPASMEAPATTMTWEKFARTVLPTAQRIELHTPRGRGSYGALVTAVNADAPPILQWDREDARNPVSWYLWHGGSPPEQFGLTPGAFHPLSAIALNPAMWGGDPDAYAHHGKGLMFVIEGARETRQAGAALFPEILKAEFHGIRSVLEAYSRNAEMAGLDEPHAAGLLVSGGEWNVRLRVTTETGASTYRLDRWD